MAGLPEVDGSRTILHVDMDAFYAAVEVLDDPSLRGLPVVVGGTGRRGVVASCSYEARAFGVRSAMPSARARKLCPHAVFLPGRHDRYSEASRQIHAIFEQYTPLVEGISLDEAFLDVTGSVRLFGPGPQIAATIRDRISGELGLACSVGVAPVKFLAKLASEAAKPHATRKGVIPGSGVVVVKLGEELSFLHPHPIEALWGVGPATAGKLRALGVTTVRELAALPLPTLEAGVGRAHGQHLFDLARAVDPRGVEPDRAVKSVSHEETYPVDVYDREQLHAEVLRMADAVATRLRRSGLAGRTVTLKLRYGDFATLTRSRTTAGAVSDGRSIARSAGALLDAIELDRGVRLLGVGVSNLLAGPGTDGEQSRLDFSAGGDGPPGDAASGPSGAAPKPDRDGWADAADAVDAVRERFGGSSIGPTALLRPGEGIKIKRRGDSQWGPTGGPPAPSR